MTRREWLTRAVSELGAVVILIPTMLFILVVLALYALAYPFIALADRINDRCDR